VTYILPFFTEARTTKEYLRAVFVLLAWCGGVLASALCLVLKVSQVSFAGSTPVSAWTFTNFAVMFGLLLNLAKVDSSYDAVSGALLEAIHKHYIGPGNVLVSKTDKSRSLFAKVMKLAGIERDALFTFFGTVFNYHFGENTLNEVDMPLKHRLRKTANFMSFVAKLDNRMLERFLEMVESPMLHYQVGRRVFQESLRDGDVSGMEMAVWLCDPLSDEAYNMARKYPHAFHITYQCDDL
jgi:hypothetical protein